MTVASQYDALLLDLDGTVYQGSDPIPGAVDAINACGLPTMYVTNNASRAPQSVAQQLRSLGLDATANTVMTSALAALHKIRGVVKRGETVLILGTDSFVELAQEHGYQVTRTADDHPVAVLHGHNPDTGWAQLSEAALAIRAGAAYIATNLDTTLPKERGLHVGNGSMVAAVVSATGVAPESAGKPGPDMFYAARDALGVHRPLAVGDRLDTDIAGGVAAGMDTLCVLTGVNGHEDVLRAPVAHRPTYVAEDLRSLGVPLSELSMDAAEGFQAHIDSSGVLIVSGGTPQSTAIGALRAAASAAWATNSPAWESIRGDGEHAQRALNEWR